MHRSSGQIYKTPTKLRTDLDIELGVFLVKIEPGNHQYKQSQYEQLCNYSHQGFHLMIVSLDKRVGHFFTQKTVQKAISSLMKGSFHSARTPAAWICYSVGLFYQNLEFKQYASEPSCPD
jgi:hypothetical protein